MYESRKDMGDVCKDVSSSIEERKDVLSEEREHHRDSEPRQDKVKLHLSNTAELGIEDHVIRELRKVFPQEDLAFEVTTLPIGIFVVRMRTIKQVCTVAFNPEELSNIVGVRGYIIAVCIQKFEEALKGVTK